mgnify:CR=1 FL=1
MSIPIVVRGNLGNDPELKFVKTGRGDTALTSFPLAYTPKEKKGDQWVEGETMWFRVVIWGDRGETLVDSLRKGDSVLVQGNFKQSSFETKDGEKKTALEISATDVAIIPKATAKKKADEVPW